MTPPAAISDFGDAVLSCWPAVVYVIGILTGLWVIVHAAQAVTWARRLWRNRVRLRGLMDRGDGQGGVPPIARRLAAAEATTQAISMRPLTYVTDPDPALGCPCCPGARSNDCSCARPCGDPQCQATGPACRWCTDPSYTRPEDCACTVRCEGSAWCAAWYPGSAVPVTWTGRLDGIG